MLELNAVTKRFGGLVAVNNVDLSVPEGEILGLVGPNGAGKTTLLNLISGIYRPDSGSIEYQGQDISKFSLDRICRIGIAKTFQHTHSFPSMTARESVMLGSLFGNGHKPGMAGAAREAADLLARVGFPAERVDMPLLNLNVFGGPDQCSPKRRAHHRYHRACHAGDPRGLRSGRGPRSGREDS
jgi:branched-chain amino acid transport system ATP-binding protein